MKWVFGFDINVPVLCLTAGERREIFYSASNVGIVYDYCSKTMTHLRGHVSTNSAKIVKKKCNFLAK